MYELEYTKEANQDVEALKKSGDIIALGKLAILLEELTEHPKTGLGKPKPLKHDYIGCWSRRISQKHRLVYRIMEEIVTVVVLQAFGHYDDK